jgi:hypothetical protein
VNAATVQIILSRAQHYTIIKYRTLNTKDKTTFFTRKGIGGFICFKLQDLLWVTADPFLTHQYPSLFPGA